MVLKCMASPMVAAGRVSFPDESKEMPIPLSSSFLLKVGQRGLPLDRGARSSSSLDEGGGCLFCLPNQAAPS